MVNDNGAAELGLDGVYSHSQIESFMQCEQKYSYRYRDGWRAPRSSRAMTLGTTVHHLLDGWWMGKDIPDLDDIAQYVIELKETPTIEECESAAEHALWLLRRYDKMYERDRERVTVLEIEQFRTFELPRFGEKRFGLTCKIDKLMESPQHGGLIFMDHKTSGTRSKEDHIDIDQQFSIYTLALRSTGTPVVCSFLDHIYTYRRKKGGEFLEWDAYPVEESFLRILVDRADTMLDVVARDAYRACERMWALRNHVYEPLRHIHFGCPNCDFRAPCGEALLGDSASERALLEEHFSNHKSRTPVRQSPIEEVELF